MCKNENLEGYTCLNAYYFETLDNAIDALLKWKETHNDPAYISFNGCILKSDTVTVDSAYLAVLGCTKAEMDAKQKAWREQYIKEEEKHKAAIPLLTIAWREKGHAVLAEKYWNTWDKMVPIRLNDIYRGLELDASLKIINVLNTGATFEEAKDVMDGQNHSNLSYTLIQSMVAVLCDRGQNFSKYIS